MAPQHLDNYLDVVEESSRTTRCIKSVALTLSSRRFDPQHSHAVDFHRLIQQTPSQRARDASTEPR
jgi:hypothetical protein